MAEQVTLRVWRGDADGGELVDYVVGAEEGEVVLDVVHRLQATQAGDLAVRWNCKAGKCGSCSAEINGRPRLMCMTRLGDLDLSEPVTVTPMRTFPVIRDLVTDVRFNYEMARQVPAFAPVPREPDGTYRMAQQDIERGQEFHKCIECFLCQNVCHVVRDHEENKQHFAGPRMFIKYAELDMHPLDTNDRRALLQEQMGLGYCNITKCCTEVCPESIKITDNAIIPLKERVVDTKYDPLVWLGSKIKTRRDVERTPVGPAGAPVSPIKRPGQPAEPAPASSAAPVASAAVSPATRSAAEPATRSAAEPATRSAAEPVAPRPAHGSTLPPAAGPLAAPSGAQIHRLGPAAAVAAAGVGFLAWALRHKRS